MQNKFVAFVDILGFKDTVKGLTEETAEDLFKTLLSLRNVEPKISDVLVFNSDNKVDVETPEVSFLAVSDCFVFTSENSWAGAVQLIATVNRAFRVLLLNNYIIRGGIDFGPLFQKDGIFFGKAYQNAVDIESNKACYPRVLLSQAAHDKFVELECDKPEGANFNLLNQLWQDKDEFSINYLKQFRGSVELPHPTFTVTTFKPKKEYLDFGKVFISEKIKTTEEPKVLKKILWLKEKWNNSVSSEYKI